MTSSWLKANVKIFTCLKPIACDRSVVFLCQKPTAHNRLAMVMGGVLRRSGSWEVVKPMVISQLKMEDACIFCNVIETFDEEK
jgi:hypothetical protein